MQKMPEKLKKIARTWLLLSFAALTLYVAFYAAFESKDLSLTDSIKSMLKDKVLAIMAVISFALTISILLALDDQNPRDENLETMTFAGLAYVLLIRRKPLLALLVLGLVGVGLTAYYVAKLSGVTFEQEGTALTIKFPGQTVYYFPIHSQWSWQNTGISLKRGQKFRYALAGYVSPGYLQDLDLLLSELRQYKLHGREYESTAWQWPITAPEGYDDADPAAPAYRWYEKAAKRDREQCEKKIKERKTTEKCYKAVTKHYNEDNGLTVKGLPHNRVVGIIHRPGHKPRSADRDNPGYDYSLQEHKDKLILFNYPEGGTKLEEATAEGNGDLWVVINDADAYRWDNAGMFFLKLVTP